MEFDEVVVKESPGLCRCCLSEGCYKDLSSEYTWMNETEVYADMLLECFDISITQQNDGPNGSNRLICEVCITRLRDACNFKKQVLDSEKNFIDMIGRGEFRPKVVIYQTEMKLEQNVEDAPQEVEYLEEDMDFEDNELPKPTVTIGQASESDTVTAEALPVKPKRGKPKKPKVGRPRKAVELDEKPNTSKAIAKGPNSDARGSDVASNTYSIAPKNWYRMMKKNAITILENSTIMPFKWHVHHYLCFYCDLQFYNFELLKAHTRAKHMKLNIETVVSCVKMDDKVKIDMSEAMCKICSKNFDNLDTFITHLKVEHDKQFADEFSFGVIPHNITKDNFKCGVCEKQYRFYPSLDLHMKLHYGRHICEQCGKSFHTLDKLKTHNLSHRLGYQCNFCSETYDSLVKRNYHEIQVHSPNKLVKCKYCKERFKNYKERSKHNLKKHNIDMPFKCTVCSRQFHVKSRMESHLREVHLKERNFSCTMCEAKFFSESRVRRHMIMHVGKKKYQCDVCKKSFSRKHILSSHIKLHNNDKKYVCSECDEAFPLVEKLESHVKLHHPKASFYVVEVKCEAPSDDAGSE